MPALAAALLAGMCALQAPPTRLDAFPLLFPIAGWANPPGKTFEQYRLYRDAGFTHINIADEQILSIADRLGLTAFYFLGTPDPATPDGRRKIDQAIAIASRHRSCVGYYIKDEPNASMFPLLARITAYIKKHDRRTIRVRSWPSGRTTTPIAYINLFPTYATPRQLGVPTYPQYVEDFVRIVKPQVLCYDNYPCVGRDGWRGDYYLNLEIVRDVARKNRLPMWAFIIISSHGPYRMPTRTDLTLQGFSLLAYGARGIYYYTYGRPRGYRCSIVDEHGQPTRYWTLARRLNHILYFWGLYIAESLAVCHVGEVPRGARGLGDMPASFPVAACSPGGCILAHLRLVNGLDGLMIVNKDRSKTRTFALKLAGRWSQIGEIPAEPRGAAQMQPQFKPAPRALQVTVPPGFARLFALK